ncbi:MAG TPA: response regulator [Chloroflexia bacterium]|nr:response regulator [Chloroflexia bacterium]
MAGELILIVDDEELIRRQAEAALKRTGYKTATAGTGYEALAILERTSPDLLLSDIRMPDLDGLQLFGRARILRPDLLGVFMTAHGSIDNVVKSMQLGVSGFLLKPFTGSELERAIQDALERGRSGQETARVRLLAPLFEAHRFFASGGDVQALCQSLVELIIRETRSDYCALFVSENVLNPASPEGSAGLRAVASYTSPDTQAFAPRIFPASRLAARSMEQARTVTLRRSTNAEQVQGGENLPGAVISIPLTSGKRALGALLVGRTVVERQFSAGEREMLEIVAAQTATHLENQRLQANLAERDERLRLFAGRFVSSQEEEKRHLAEEIQSELLPELTASRQKIQAYIQKVRPASAQDLLQTEERLQGLINSVKKMTGELRPVYLDEYGLSAALRQYVRDLQEDNKSKCTISYTVEGEEPPRLESAVEIALFRAIQDALVNACRQDQAATVNLVVRVSGPRNKPQQLAIEITDNGKGFEPQQYASQLGLLTMQERARLAGATCEITGAPGQGTRVTMTYQIPQPG